MTTLAGGNALSTFRAQQLQPALEAIHPRISGIAARFVHLVATDAAPTPPELERLAALLTYGDPYAGPGDGTVLIVTPRLGTPSPWASKATDIARNCGLAIRRVERITVYRFSLKAGLLGKQYESGDELAARLTELVQERARPLAAQAARADFDGKQASRLVQRVQVLESTDNTARAELAERQAQELRRELEAERRKAAKAYELAERYQSGRDAALDELAELRNRGPSLGHH